MKNLIVLLLMFFSASSHACSCATFLNFCQWNESSEEETVFMIKMPDNINPNLGSIEFYDVEIIIQLFGPELAFDSLTLRYYPTSCHYPLQIFPDTMILKKSTFIKDSLINYPFYEFVYCQNNYLTLENGLISGNIERVAGNYDQFFDSLRYDDFLEWYPECAASVKTEDVGEFSGVLVFPNPTLNVLHLDNKSVDGLNYQLYNSLGEIISRGDLSSRSTIEIEMKDLPNGVYYLRLEDGTRQNVRKVMKL